MMWSTLLLHGYYFIVIYAWDRHGVTTYLHAMLHVVLVLEAPLISFSRELSRSCLIQFTLD